MSAYNGGGNVAKRPNGRWRARYRDEDRREHSRHFTRKRDAVEWLASVSGERPSEIDARAREKVRQRAERPDPTERRCAVYRHYDDAGTLLYVGITVELHARTRAHAATAEWAQHAATATAQWFDTVDAARTAEAEAIRTERPVYNAITSDAGRDQQRRVANYAARALKREPVSAAPVEPAPDVAEPEPWPGAGVVVDVEPGPGGIVRPLRVDEVARLLGLTEDTLRYWAYTGRGPASFKLGRRRVYDPRTLAVWVREQQTEAS